MAAGTLDATRLAHYLKLHDEITDAADRQLQQASDKVKGKSSEQRPSPAGGRR